MNVSDEHNDRSVELLGQNGEVKKAEESKMVEN